VLLDLLSLKEKYNLSIKGVLHIGAHYGQENRIYDILDIKNRIFFEPLESNFRVLEKNVGEGYQLVKVALGNKTGKVTMHVEEANNGQSSSILKPSLHLHQYPHIQFTKSEEVDIIRLDDFDYNQDDFNLINIDVQGFELEVFKGAEKKLEKIDYIISEINRDELYENCAKIDEVKIFLSKYGFELVEVDWAGVTWGDGLFIKK
jgi:FkbM family methyltransferase